MAIRLEQCIKRLVEESKGLLNRRQAQEIFDMLEEGKKAAFAKNIDYDDFVIEKAARIAADIRKAAMIEKRNALINAKVYSEATNKLKTFVASGLTIGKAYQAMLVGVETNVENGLFSIDKQHKTILNTQLLGSAISKLEAENLLPVWRDASNARQIARELWAISQETTHPESTKEVKRTAEIIHETQTYAKNRLNKAGAAIDDLGDFIASTSHDQYRMRNAWYSVQETRSVAQRLNPKDRAPANVDNYQIWRDYILPKLDHEKTFGAEADVESFLRKTYDALITGIHLRTVGDDEKLFAFKGPSNLAKSLSQRRVLHFKDADSWFDYNEVFGSGRNGLGDSIAMGFNKAARDISLMENLGTNPQAMINRLIDDSKAGFRNSFNEKKGAVGADGPQIPKRERKLANTERSIRNFYANVSGDVLIPENPTLARHAQVFRDQQSMAKLGGALLSSFADIPVMAAELSYQGDNFFSAQTKAFDVALTGHGNKARKEIGLLIGQGIDASLGGITSRFSATDSLAGQSSAMMRNFFKFSGLSWWTDNAKIGMGTIMTARLGQLKKLDFTSLPDETKMLFNHYGIREEHWNTIRAVKGKAEGTKALHITPEQIAELPDDKIVESLRIRDGRPDAEYRKSQIDAFKQEAALRLGVYFQDRIDHAILEPGAREAAILNQGLKRGTVEGEAIRMMMQFKSFPTTFLTKVWGRGLYAKGSADYKALLAVVTSTMLMGYTSMVAKDLVKGKEPRDPTSIKTAIAALTQGGGFGILGDFAFGDYNRFGGGLIESVAGPAAGAVGDVAKIWAAAREGKDVSAKTLNVALSNTPYLNLFYAREPLNRLFIYQLQEYMNPGYLRRMESRMQQQNNQRFLISPSS